MSPPPNPIPSPTRSAEFLANAFCTRCGYDLRTNNVSGPCPNCGLGLSYATFASGLANANPIWLHRVYLGITGLMIAQILTISGNVIQVVGQLAEYAGAYYPYSWYRQLDYAGLAIHWFAALYLVAAAEPGDPRHSEQRTSPRKLLLWLGWTGVVLTVIRPLIAPLGIPAAPIGFLAIAVDLAATIMLFLYLQRLGQRDGSPMLKRHLPVLVTLVIVSRSLNLVVGLRNYNTIGSVAPMQMYMVTHVFATAVWIYTVYVLFHLRRSLGSILATEKLA